MRASLAVKRQSDWCADPVGGMLLGLMTRMHKNAAVVALANKPACGLVNVATTQ
jgi:hypothetical protein